MKQTYIGHPHAIGIADTDLSVEEIERFWSKVNIGEPDECWTWTASLLHGYGHFDYHGSSSKSRKRFAHRIAFALCNQAVDDGQSILHSCDNPPCCNPAHLRIGSQQDNMDDRSIRGRAPHGESAYQSCFTEQQVADLRREYVTTEVRMRDLARRHSVGKTTMQHILHNRTWIDGPYAVQAAQKAASKAPKRLEKWQVEAMRRAHEEAGLTGAQLARAFGVAPMTVSCILRNVNWRSE